MTFINSKRAANSLIPSLTCLLSLVGVGGASSAEGEDTNPGGVAIGGVVIGGVGAIRGTDTGGVTDGLNSCGYFGVGIKSPWFLLASFKKDKCK